MIDLHTHILPAIDDGARTLSESLAMASIALADGITCVAATPHDPGVEVGFPDRVRKRVSDLEAALQEHSIKVKLVTGSELYAVPDLVERLSTGRALTLASSRYFLLEFPPTDLPIFAAQLVFEAQAARMVPIVAHPARTPAFHSNPDRLYDLVARGALAQVTSGSLIGLFGPRVQTMAQALVEHNLVHLISSDAHGSGDRAPRLSQAVEVVRDIVGDDLAQAMVTTRPQSVLTDESLSLDPPRHYQPRRRWFWSS